MSTELIFQNLVSVLPPSCPYVRTTVVEYLNLIFHTKKIHGKKKAALSPEPQEKKKISFTPSIPELHILAGNMFIHLWLEVYNYTCDKQE